MRSLRVRNATTFNLSPALIILTLIVGGSGGLRINYRGPLKNRIVPQYCILGHQLLDHGLQFLNLRIIINILLLKHFLNIHAIIIFILQNSRVYHSIRIVQSFHLLFTFVFEQFEDEFLLCPQKNPILLLK